MSEKAPKKKRPGGKGAFLKPRSLLLTEGGMVVGLCKGAGVETYEDREVHWKTCWERVRSLSTP